MGKQQRSRAHQAVPEETVAAYTAARAFLLGEWFGASLGVASFTLLYLFTFARPDVAPRVAVATCLAMLAVAGFAFLRNRAYYERLGFRWAPRWHVAALVVAGSAAVFWLLFALLLVLSWRGVELMPRS